MDAPIHRFKEHAEPVRFISEHVPIVKKIRLYGIVMLGESRVSASAMALLVSLELVRVIVNCSVYPDWSASQIPLDKEAKICRMALIEDVRVVHRAINIESMFTSMDR
jgi:hypothetical protein